MNCRLYENLDDYINDKEHMEITCLVSTLLMDTNIQNTDEPVVIDFLKFNSKEETIEYLNNEDDVALGYHYDNDTDIGQLLVVPDDKYIVVTYAVAEYIINQKIELKIEPRVFCIPSDEMDTFAEYADKNCNSDDGCIYKGIKCPIYPNYFCSIFDTYDNETVYTNIK